MDSSSSNLACDICYNPYDIEVHIPKSLSCCGRTTCKTCIENTLRNNQSRCPWCKASIEMASGTRTNFQLLDIVEESSQWEKCPHHNEQMKLFCSQDKKKVCIICEVKSECKNHDWIPLSDMKPVSEKRISELKDYESRTKAQLEQYDKVISQNRLTFENIICDDFDQQFHELKKAKAKALMKINSFWSEKQVEFMNAFGQDSSLRTEVQTKIKNYMNFMKAENPLSVIEEDLTMLKNRVELLVGRGQDVVNFEEQLAKMAPLARQCLTNMLPKPNPEDFNEIINQETRKIKETPIINEGFEEREYLTIQVCNLSVYCGESESGEKTLFIQSIFDDNSFISAFNANPNGMDEFSIIRLNSPTVKETVGVCIDFDYIRWNEWNLRALECILSLQVKTSQLKLSQRQNLAAGRSLEETTRIFSALFKKPQDIELLKMSIFDRDDLMLFNSVAPQLSSLKTLTLQLDLPLFAISKPIFNDLTESISLLAVNLENFELDLLNSRNSIKSLAFSMPKIEKFSLNVSNVRDFDNKKFSEIIENLSVLLPQVKHFEIGVRGTAVTSSCVESLCEKMSHIEHAFITYSNPEDENGTLLINAFRQIFVSYD